jgi:chromosome segregation ATPase
MIQSYIEFYNNLERLNAELLENVKNLPNRDYIQKTDEDKYLKLSIEKNLEKNGLSIDTELTNENSDKESSEVLNLQNIEIVHGDENMNEFKSAERKDGEVLLTKIENRPESDLNEDYTNLAAEFDDGAEIAVSSDEYNQSRQKIEHELQNLETIFSKVSDKAAAQETEIKKLKTTEEKYINSLREKNRKIEEMGQIQQKLEEKVSNYKKQRQEMLNEMYNLKKEINRFISIING